MLLTDLPAELWADTQPLAVENLDPVVDSLIAEFTDHLPAWVVIEQVVLACEQLLAAGVRTGLFPATESLARTRLRTTPMPGGAQQAVSVT